MCFKTTRCTLTIFTINSSEAENIEPVSTLCRSRHSTKHRQMDTVKTPPGHTVPRPNVPDKMGQNALYNLFNRLCSSVTPRGGTGRVSVRESQGSRVRPQLSVKSQIPSR